MAKQKIETVTPPGPPIDPRFAPPPKPAPEPAAKKPKTKVDDDEEPADRPKA